MKNDFIIKGNLIDILSKEIYPASVIVSSGKITAIERTETAGDTYILPGFIDAHVHIESSMLIPTEFARLACVHGTVATVSDPHEIANVCGVPGVKYMIENSRKTPFKFFFGAPSCVPATSFETAGATIDAKEIEELLQQPDIWYLSEMMNYPGVLQKDEQAMKKIEAAHRAKKPVDGHAPSLRGNDALAYINAGISTDHECFTIEEALDKLNGGMHIIIREGSAAKNYTALSPLISQYPEQLMFCSDDKHPDELVLHHINALVKRAVDDDHNVFDVLRVACINPVLHYNLPVGLLRVDDPADFIIIDNLTDFNVRQTYIDGELVAENGQTKLERITEAPINQFHALHKAAADFEVSASAEGCTIRVIEALEGQLITNELHLPALIVNGKIISDTDKDILKIAVINRYTADAPVAIGFVKNFGLKQGAIASTVAHDCHNIIVVGVDDLSIAAAVNKLIDMKGGIAVAKSGSGIFSMALPVAGLMSNEDGYIVAEKYAEIDRMAKELGTPLHAPFMTLSFMALLVIPSLKLSDLGLFSGANFNFTPVVV